MTKARDIASAAPAPSTVSATELGYVDGVTSAIQTQLDAKLTTATASSTYIPKTLTTTTGDIIYASAANTPARLAIGSTDQVLKVTGGIPAWATPSSGASFVGVILSNSVDAQSVANNTQTALTYDTAVVNNGGYTVGASSITIPTGKSGYYTITFRSQFGHSGSGYRVIYVMNGATMIAADAWYQGGDGILKNSGIFYLAAGDVITFEAKQNSGGSLIFYKKISEGNYATINYLGA